MDGLRFALVDGVQAGPVTGVANGVQPAPRPRQRAAREGRSGVGVVVADDEEAAEDLADQGLRDLAHERVGAGALERGEG